MNEQLYYWACQAWSVVILAMFVGLGILTGQFVWFGICALFLIGTMVRRHQAYEAGDKADGDVHHY